MPVESNADQEVRHLDIQWRMSYSRTSSRSETLNFDPKASIQIKQWNYKSEHNIENHQFSYIYKNVNFIEDTIFLSLFLKLKLIWQIKKP